MLTASRRIQQSVVVGECGDLFALLNEDLAREHQAERMRRFDLGNEHETIGHYRRRVCQCEAPGEYAVAADIRHIPVQESSR